ncbi:hypothetical protein AX16_004429 [Volvariella volvacea WC 439]|nr:hypothetical protein AX16_004429 [Volvariella volvacea WC 439]
MPISDLDFAITHGESNLVLRILERVDPHSARVVTGEAAFSIFQLSDLPPETLSEIWEIADAERKGYLDERGVAIAVRLMGWAQSSRKISPAFVHTAGPLPVLRGLSIPEKPKVLITPLRLEDAGKYFQAFLDCHPEGGMLSSERAREAFLSTELAQHDLEYLWSLADHHQRDALDAADFALGMHLINLLLSRQIHSLPPSITPQTYKQVAMCIAHIQASTNTSPPIPPSNPVGLTAPPSPVRSRPPPPTRKPPVPPKGPLKPPIRPKPSSISRPGPSNPSMTNVGKELPSLPSPPTSPTSPPMPPSTSPPELSLNDPSIYNAQPEDIFGDINAQEQRLAEDYFTKLDKKGIGYLESEVAFEFMRHSRLSEDDLTHIWKLADRDQDGCLTLEEFTVAVHLMAKRLGGVELPPISPPSPTISRTPRHIDVRHHMSRHSVADPFSHKAFGKLPEDTLNVPGPALVNGKQLHRSVSDINLAPMKSLRPRSMSNISGNKQDDGGESARLLQAQNNQLTKDLKHLQQTCTDLTSELEHERSLHAHTTSKVSSLKSQLQDLEQSMSHVLSTTSESNTQKIELLKQIEQLVRASSNHAGEMTQLRLQLDDTIRNVDETKYENEVLKQRVDELDTALLVSNETKEQIKREGEILRETNELLKMRLKEMEEALVYEPPPKPVSAAQLANVANGVAGSSGSSNSPTESRSGSFRGRILKSERSKSNNSNSNNGPTTTPPDEDLPGNPRTMALLMADVTRENESLKARLRNLEENMGKLLETHSSTERKQREEIFTLTRENRSIISKVHSLEAETAQMKITIDREAGNLQNMKLENERLKAQLREATRRNGELEQQQEQDSQRRVGELEAELERLRALNRELQEEGDRGRAAGGPGRGDSGPLRQDSMGQDMSVPPPAYDDHAFIPPES